MSPLPESPQEKAWRRQRKWTRAFTARYLDDRSATILAFLLRLPGKWPQRSAHVGFWLQDNAPAVFAQIHERLAALPDDAAREALSVTELLKP